MAEQLVTQLALKAIDAEIPGETWEWNPGKMYETYGKFIARKDRIIAVFKWMLARTEGFSVPIMVSFTVGESPAIGLCLGRALNTLSCKLFSMNESGIKMPRIESGWHNGPGNPFTAFSDIARKHGILGSDNTGFTHIDLYGDVEFGKTVVALKDIAP
jgi:hypothetical protein